MTKSKKGRRASATQKGTAAEKKASELEAQAEVPVAEESVPISVKADAPKERKKPGPKPKTEAQKAEDAKKRAELKKAAAAMKPEFILQYQGAEVNVEELASKAAAAFKADHKRTLITSMKLYLKPEENAAYYVINDGESGKVDM